MSYLRMNAKAKEKAKAKVRARKAKVKARRAKRAKAKGRKAKVKAKGKAKEIVVTVVSQDIRRGIAGQMKEIGIRMTMDFTTSRTERSRSSSNLSREVNLVHLITQTPKM